MRKLLVALLSAGCLFIGTTRMSAQIMLDGSNHCTNGVINTASVSCTLPSVVSGDLITVEYSDRNGSVTSVSDGANGAYTGIYYVPDSADPNYSGMAYFANAEAGSLTVTASLSTSNDWANISVQAWKGAATSNVLDTSAILQRQTSTSGTVANANCGSPHLPAGAGELIIAYLVPDWDFSASAGPGYTLIDTDTNTSWGNPSFPEYWIQSAPLATSGAFTNAADDFTDGCVAFKPASTTTLAGNISTIAGSAAYGYTGDGGPAINAELEQPEGIAVDSAGNVYIPDFAAGVVRKLAVSTGVISTVAGTGNQGYSGDGQQATSAELTNPTSVALDASGNIYIADYGNNRIRKVTVSTGIITTVAGTGTGGYTGDGGAAMSAEISYPAGVLIDGSGNLFISDSGNSVIRKVTASTGKIATIAGNHIPGYSGDYGLATSAELNNPASMAFDASGNLYIADFENNVVRKVTVATGIITTIAGNGTRGYAGDGGPSTSAELDCPASVAVDAAGNVFISDYGNHAIRFVSANAGTITTIAGNGTSGFSGDGGPAISAQLSYPHGVALDSAGNLYIGDCNNHRIREVLSPDSLVAVSVSPTSASLYGAQTQQFEVTVTNTSNVAVTWSLGPGGAGSISSSGLYTAPASIAAQQTVTVIATSQADSTASASATITLLPSIAVGINPTSATLLAGQQDGFTATVTNTSNTNVNWSISPTGAGAINSSGVYTAPTSISTQQTVTVTATSQADSSKSATATITLSPNECITNGYGYERAIAIDHTKVPNSDQVNFPFLFEVTDPAFKTTAEGGHVADANGYDIIFTSDAAGDHALPFEQESYSGTTGAMTYWIQIPTLSHSQDTIIYMWYGNSNVTASQANPSAVWSNGYVAVWHFGNGTSLSLADSAGSHNLTNTNGTAASGTINGALQCAGNASLTAANSSDLNLSSGTVEAWISPILWGGGNSNYFAGNSIWSPGGGYQLRNYNNQVDFYNVNASSGYYLIRSSNGLLTAEGQWTQYVATFTGSTPTLQLYANAALQSVQVYETGNSPVLPGGTFTLCAAPEIAGDYADADLDEVRVSNVVRSADWIATEYNNLTSPSTSYALSAENTVAISPAVVSLAGSQVQQFTAIQPANSCSTAVGWSISPAGVGNISSNGLYTAPAPIQSPQTITVTATSQSATGTAAVTLIPQAPSMSLRAVVQSPYPVGTSENFTVTVLYSDGTPASGASVNLGVSGANSIAKSAVTDANGIAAFTYAGSNGGTDTIEATATIYGSFVASNAIMVSWTASSTPAADGTVTILGQPSVFLEGLLGAFTDSNGTVIEPLAIGASQRVFVVPPGATQFQLGIDDDYYADNFGPGFVVDVNDVPITVPAGALPWVWVSGGLNSSYQYGFEDGTTPIVAATNLTAGQPVVVAYQSGLNSPGGGDPAQYNANGVTGVGGGCFIGSGGEFPPTCYMNAGSYPVGQPVSITVQVTNGSGSAMANVPVILSVTGANPRQLQATTDSSGMAAFTYVGLTSGTDTLKAEAVPSGSMTLQSSQSAITWVTASNLPAGSLTLSPSTVSPQPVGGQETFTVFAADSYGNAVPNLPLSLVISGADQNRLVGTTDSTGHATIVYQDQNPGTASVKAVSTINNLVAVSNVVSVPWTLMPSTTTGSGGSSTLSISIDSPGTVFLPNPLNLSGTVADTALPPGDTISTTWSQVSGPGTASFTNSQQVSTTVAFSAPGNYVLQLAASDANGSGTAQITVTVNPAPQVTQGWIGSPADGAAVSGIVPIIVASSETLQSGTLTYYPDGNPNGAVTLNAQTTGSGQIGTLDTTTLANGSYWITLQATDTNGDSEYNLVFVTVTGNYKPGRVTSTVTDLVVPANGLAIKIQRTYDSLNASTSGDFGYGWNLGTSVDLTVDARGDVSFTLGGQRRTFYLTPEYGGFLPFYVPAFTPEPGLYGTLNDSAPGCTDLLDYLVPDGNLWACVGGGFYSPPGYIYTDPTGTSYTITANGNLQSIVDKNGNALTITANGVTSSTGLSVAFVRDSKERITQITDPKGNTYEYGYDDNGNLVSVTYPNIPVAATYSYDSNHLYLSGTDFDGNPLPTTDYYGANDSDPNGLPLNGRLESVTDSLGEITSYAYNLDTNTTTITYPPDAGGNQGTATMVYDNLGDLLSSTDPLGHTTTNVYDSNQNLRSSTDPMGYVTCYTYDASGNRLSTSVPQTGPTCSSIKSTTAYNPYSEPTQTTDEDSNVRNFNYDSNYNPASVTDGLGTLASFAFNSDGTMQLGAVGYDISAQPSMASSFTYDQNGNLICRVDALGRATSYAYDNLGHKTAMTPPPISGTSACLSPGTTNSSTTTYQYDVFGNLKETDAPLGRTTKSSYDGNGNKTQDIDANVNVTNYKYDALNRLKETDYPDQTSTKKTYDFRGNVVDEWDQAGNQTHHVYDLAGRQASVTQAYGSSSATTTSYTYDNDGHQLTETDALNHTTNYAYDPAGDLTGVSGMGGTFSYGYDNARNRTSMTDGNNHTTTYHYVARKRLVETDYPDGTRKTYGYDGPGNLISVTDQNTNEVQYTYDAANQLKIVIQTASPSPQNTTNVLYDGLGDPTSIEDANTHATGKSFDLFGELMQTTLPDGTTLTETRTYDLNGNLKTLVHFNGVTTTYTYDTLNRLLGRSTPGESTVSFTYTSTGKRQTMTDASGTNTYNYDNMDRLTSKQTPEGTLSYTYDAAGDLASISSSNSGGASVSYTYDTLDRLSTVVDSRLAGNQTTSYSYDTASNVASVTHPNGVQYGFNYDQLNHLKQIATQQTGYLYTFDLAGHRKTATELNGRSVAWDYDGIYRLNKETISSDPSHNNGSVSYSLDPVGNRLSDSSSLSGVPSSSGTFDPDDELSSETYDQNGNVTASGGKSFTYDAENHLISMGGTVSLVYDGDGNRVAKTVSGVTTKYLVDDLNPTGNPQVMDELVGGAVTRTYTYGLQRISQNQVISNAWTPSFYGYDGFGTVRQLTNTAGAITDTYDYDAFGNKINSTGTTPNNYLYRGEQWDSDLGLYYLRARYYNPTTGRFMSRDPEEGNPFDPKTLHKYLYAGGDPVNLKDPTGKDLVGDALARAWSTARTVIEGTRIGESALCFLKFISDIVRVAPVGFYNGIPINANIAVFYGELQDCLELASYL